MPGVVFLIVVPTANFERELICGNNSYDIPPPVPSHANALLPAAALSGGAPGAGQTVVGSSSSNNLNINLPEGSNNAVLRLEVELRDKNAPKYRRGAGRGIGKMAAGRGGRGGGGGGVVVVGGGGGGDRRRPLTSAAALIDNRNIIVPLEKVLEELLTKLQIEHVTWTTGKKGYYHQVVFPLQAGEPCETTLHCLTELGIGTKLNSNVSVLQCSVSYDALFEAANKDDYCFDESLEDLSKWKSFVESIKSKLTVKQVVDGVRAGGSLSFDYLLLIVTADSLAALGLIENNASNIVAAMLVSPLMGPVMSITFGTIISDRELIRVGFISLALGMFISGLFGFIFGLILGTTEMPWGSGDWPTEEMRSRGNARSLWMGVLWALTSGTGVAVALLQGSAGPLIGVAISASLLPPVVNCGLFWALACIWLIYPGIRIPHLKGETLEGNSSYPFIYTNYLPTEFLINGIVSGLLTVVNVICIFITAIIVLKIKEVSAPYTASPDLKRFWETDLRTARKTNRSTIRQRKTTLRERLISGSQGLDEPRNHELDTVLERALKEAEEDITFKKVKRMSYSSNAAGELTQRLAKLAGLKSTEQELNNSGALHGAPTPLKSGMNSLRNSKESVNLKALDNLVDSLLQLSQQQQQTSMAATSPTSGPALPNLRQTNKNSPSNHFKKGSFKLNRWRPSSRSAHSFAAARHVNIKESAREQQQHGSSTMPTIMETGIGGGSLPTTSARTGHASWANGSGSFERTPFGVRNVLQAMANAPQRLSQSYGVNDEEKLKLTQNNLI